MRVPPALVSPAATLLYRAWVQTLRFDDGGGLQRILAAVASGRPVMLAFWHADLFALGSYGVRFLPGRVATIVSDSREGELVSQIINRVGYATARGSSTRGGLKAMLGLKNFMKQGRIGVVTLDGPRGPRHAVKEGAVYLAHRSGAVLFPVCSKLHGMHEFQSWDRFQLPWPFTRCQVGVGQAMAFTEAKDDPGMLARESLRLQTAMHATRRSMD